MVFKCRMVKPRTTNFVEVEANNAEGAAITWHFDRTIGSCWVAEGESGRYKVWFARVEVEGEGEMVVRTYQYGLWRKGGVKSGPQRTLADVAKEVGWEGNPEELLEPGWPGEEVEAH